MKFIFDSIFHIITWVGIGLSLVFIGIFWDKDSFARTLSFIALAFFALVMILLLARQHFWATENRGWIEASWQLTPRLKEKLVKNLAKLPPEQITVSVTVSDAENAACARDFIAILKEAGWQVEHESVLQSPNAKKGLLMIITNERAVAKYDQAFLDILDQCGFRLVPGLHNGLSAEFLEAFPKVKEVLHTHLCVERKP